MKLTLTYHNVPSSRSTHSLVETLITSLLPSLKIDEAVVRLEQAHEASPAYRTHVHLVTPGPDVFAEAQDHTLLAAINKVVAGLKDKIAHRTQKRDRRSHNESLVSSRHVSAALGH
ncbi:MAG: hypothetical protein JWO89_1900 [Verrucomicrobiaceae bacterium]|nr:hypothetical protein [Verrucomicrobiaceae bacterium]